MQRGARGKCRRAAVATARMGLRYMVRRASNASSARTRMIASGRTQRQCWPVCAAAPPTAGRHPSNQRQTT
eukprot:4910741-Prymnesium_polylepis.2